MTGPKGFVLSATAAGFLIAAGQVHAQQDRPDLSAQEVRSFLDGAEQDLTQAVQAGEYARLLGWTKDNLADEATFVLSQEFYVGDERKSFAVTSLDKQDMLRLGRIAVGVLSAMPSPAVQDYSLDIEVVKVDPIGPNAATATTRITESGKLALSRGAPPGGSGDQASGSAQARETPQAGSSNGGAQRQGADPIQIEATAQCSHLIRRGENADRLVIGMTTCEARAASHPTPS